MTRLLDFAVRRYRPRWTRRFQDEILTRYESFAPVKEVTLPDGHILAVVAPHPDDESIGCGGLIALWSGLGRDADVFFLTAGERGGAAARDPNLTLEKRDDAARGIARTRQAEAVVALDGLGARAHWFDGADGALHMDEDRLVRLLAAQWRAAPPDLIAAPFPADRHSDHVVAASIVGRAASAALQPDVPVLGYEVWSPAPINAVLDISAVAERKWRAIAAHASQVATTDYLSAARAMGTYRAISSGKKWAFAEGFHMQTVAEYADLAARLKV